MVKLGKKPIRINIYGPPKFGKSHLAAMFVKNFDGIYCDFAKTQQISSMSKGGKAPEYHVADVGDAAIACENVGITEDQYRFVRSWESFMETIEYAKAYRDSSLKANHRVWIVLDDSTNMRWQCAQYAMIQNKHTSLSQPDWSMASMLLSSVFQDLEGNFNVAIINQMKDAYENDVSTGKKVPAFYPPNLDYIADVTLGYEIVTKDDGSKYPILKVDSLKNLWICQKDRPRSIIFEDPSTISPEIILKTLKFDESIW